MASIKSIHYYLRYLLFTYIVFNQLVLNQITESWALIPPEHRLVISPQLAALGPNIAGCVLHSLNFLLATKTQHFSSGQGAATQQFLCANKFRQIAEIFDMEDVGIQRNIIDTLN